MTSTSSSFRRIAPTAPMAPEPPRRRGRRGRRVIIAAAVVAVVVLALVWVVAFSSVFGVRNVIVKGASSVSPASVRSAARVPRGTPLIRLDTGSIAHRVEAALPALASAQVSTSFPSTVTITVTERVPVGYTRDGSRILLIDRHGVQYRSVTSVPPHLAHFVLPTGKGQQSTGAALAAVAAALPPALRARVVTMQAMSPGAISLSLREGISVNWGGAGDSAQKARLLAVLVAKHPSVIDVSDPDQPFTR